MLSGHLSGALLTHLAWLTNATRALEIGSYGGYSALALLDGMAPTSSSSSSSSSSSVEMVCVDPFTSEPAAEDVFHAAVKGHPLAANVRLLKSTGIDALATLRREARATGAAAWQPFDIVFIDADKRNQIHYYDALFADGDGATPPLLAPRGVVVVDNTLWYGKCAAPVDEHHGLTKRIHAFNEHVASDARTAQVLLPVRDGMTVIRRAGI
jgi:caffeoyl-CoA O-methyltransferase